MPANLRPDTDPQIPSDLAPGVSPDDSTASNANAVTSTPGRKNSTIRLIQYDAETLQELELDNVEELFPLLSREKVNWIEVDGLGNMSALHRLSQHFGLHPLAMEDVVHGLQRPKIEDYNDHIFVAMQVPSFRLHDAEGKLWQRLVAARKEDDDEPEEVPDLEISFKQINLFFGENFLITLQENAPVNIFNPLRLRLRSGHNFVRSRGHDYLAYALLDCGVDCFFPTLELLSEIIEKLEDELLERPTHERVLELHDIKRQLMAVRRNVWPTRELFTALTRDEKPFIRPETRIFLRDCYDHTIRIMDVIESYRDLIAGLMDIYLSSVGMRTNEVMRILTVISSIFIPLTFITGIYGMNFENMPGLSAGPLGFALCLGGMFLLAAGMIGLFWYKKWI
jgi:magnesium transporter